MTESDTNQPVVAPLGQEARQKAIDVLCESFARDELDVEDFERRVELVAEADSLSRLRAILADLPTGKLPPESRQLAPRPTVAPDTIAEHSLVVGVMGGAARAGSWVPARQNWALGVMGGCQLDFREAQLGPGVTEVRALAIMGGVELLVPRDVRVECSGIGIMGGFEHQGSVSAPPDLDAPIIRVTGLALMGGVAVSVRYPGETARDARLRLKAERKAQRQIAKGR